jgi:hypothetical protein
MGVVKPMAVASAKGMRKIEEKNRMVAAATAAPRINCIDGFGNAKPRRPSLMKRNTPSPVAPTEYRSAATAVPGHAPAIDLITASPQDNKAKPHKAKRRPDLAE